MQKSTAAQGNFNPAEMLNTRKRIGSTVYVKKVYLKNDAGESMQDKIIRLVKNELNCSQKNSIMVTLQTEKHPTNKGGAILETRALQACFVVPFSPQGENAERLPERSSV